MNAGHTEERRPSWLAWMISPNALLRLAILAAIPPLLGLLGELHWFLDLFNHLQAQYFVALALLLLALLTWRKWKAALIAGLALVIPATRLLPLYAPTSPTKSSAILKVASFNVLTSNTHYEPTIDWIRNTDPDFIYLAECNPRWLKELQPLDDRFPHSSHQIVSGNFGFGFRSRHPMVSQTVHQFGELELPMLEARVATPHGDITVFGCHPVPPVNAFWAGERDLYLHELGKRAAAAKGQVVILGDLNATRWSVHMKAILEHFHDTQDGHGYSATWMRNNWLATIPIDHILQKGFSATISRETGPDLHSDHRPVIAELAW